MSALLIIHRDTDGRLTNIPFTYRDGEMMALVEEIADTLAGGGMVDSLWEGVAADRLGIILNQRGEIKDLTKRLEQETAWAGLTR
jgi:hypothetical protein